MAGQPIRRARQERTDALLADAETLDHLCGDIASGATLGEWCKQRDISFSVVNSWIESDEERKKRYLEGEAMACSPTAKPNGNHQSPDDMDEIPF